jgi:MFS family permease
MNLWATLIGAVFCLPCGWLIDRWGIRRLALLTVVLLAIVVYGLSRAGSPAEVAVWVTLTRGLGQSMLSVLSITLLGKQLRGSMPLAMGLYAVVFTMLMAVATGGLGAAILAVDWRTAWGAQSILLVAVLVPSLWWLPRSNSIQTEEAAAAATRPTEASAGRLRTAEATAEATVGATLAQALATPCFWVFALSIAFFGLISSGLSLFSQYVLEERGFGEQVFHHTLIIGLLAGLAANLLTGWAARYWPLSRLLSLALLVLAFALGMFPCLSRLWQVYGYATLMGVAGGMLTVLFFIVWKQAFGQQHLGKIQGAAQMLSVLASAIGPLSVAWGERVSGSYAWVFITAAFVAATLAVIAALTSVPSTVRWRAERGATVFR